MTTAKELIALAGRAPEYAEKPKALANVTISPADARHILVAIDKLPPSFYSTEAYGAAIRLHQQLIRHDIEHAKTMKALLANADKLVGVCDLQQAMCRQITTEGVSKAMKADLKERMVLLDDIKELINALRADAAEGE